MKTEKEKREEEEEDLRPFRIHAYSKEELAMFCFREYPSLRT